MSFINHHTKQIHCKVIYSGPLGSGKTSNLKWISGQLNKKDKDKQQTYESEGEGSLPFELPAHSYLPSFATSSTAFASSSLFDFLPLSIGEVHGFETRLHLYTLPSNKSDETAKQILLKGIDGLVFVADSQWDRLESNLQSIKELQERLTLQGVRLRDLPVVLQYNKRDLDSSAPLKDLRSYINLYSFKEVEAEAHRGVGVVSSLKGMTKMLLAVLKGEELY